MAAGKTMDVRRWQAILVTSLISVLIVNCSIGVCTGSVPIASVVSWHMASYSQPRLVYLQPGLRIKNKAPQDWSHLVIKSLPRLVSGDRGSLPAGSSKTATMFRNVLLANVKPVDMNEKDFELTQVGLGICVPDPQDEDQDIVVTADRLEALGLDHLSMVQKMVLDVAEVEMAEGRIIARTPTFALFRAHHDDRHRGKAFQIQHSLRILRRAYNREAACWRMGAAAAVGNPASALHNCKAFVVQSVLSLRA